MNERLEQPRHLDQLYLESTRLKLEQLVKMYLGFALIFGLQLLLVQCSRVMMGVHVEGWQWVVTAFFGPAASGFFLLVPYTEARANRRNPHRYIEFRAKRVVLHPWHFAYNHAMRRGRIVRAELKPEPNIPSTYILTVVFGYRRSKREGKWSMLITDAGEAENFVETHGVPFSSAC